MPQIASLLSPKGANQQRQRPNVENSPIASYGNGLKNNTFSYNPIKTKPVKSESSIFSRLLGVVGLGENKARIKLNQILTVLQKMDERKERDYQIVFLQQETQKENDNLRHKEIVNLFVQATKRRKKNKSLFKKMPMAGSLPSTMLIAGGALALLAISSTNAFAGIKKNITELETNTEKEFKKDIDEFSGSFNENEFKDGYKEIVNENKPELDGLDKIRIFFEEKFSNVLTTEKDPSEEFEQDANKLLTDLEKHTEEMDSIVESMNENQSEAETKRLNRQANPSVTVDAPQPTTVPKPATATPTTEPSKPRTTATPISNRRETVQRAASLSIQRETGASTKEETIKKLGQIVDNDPSPGQKSYGIFGMNTTGGIISFVKQYGKQFGLENLRPGSSEFDKKWIEISKTRSSEFFNAQLNWYEKNKVSPMEAKLLSVLPPEVAKDPRVLIYMADRRLQYHTVMEDEAISTASLMTKTPEEFIEKMTSFDKQNVDQAFATYLSNNPRNRPGLINRIEQRQIKSLKSENINFLGNLIDQNSREIDLAYMGNGLQNGSVVFINNTNIVSRKNVSFNVNDDQYAHPLVG